MNNTLNNWEHLIISDLFYEPKYGDIVVFELSDNPTYTMPLIKRVIATEGQTVEIHRDGVYVDGTYLEEDYVYLRPGMNYLTYGGMNAVTENGETFYRYHVGEGEIFVMGDNRFNSSDGRVFGPISVECVLGRVLFRFSPLSKFGRVE
jgi:signal peptidase I